MSQEVLEIIKQSNLKSLQMQLALQCAPLLTGIKMSNLLIVHKDNAMYVRDMFANTKISLYELTATNDKVTFLLYRADQLHAYLQDDEVRRLLQVLGYQEITLEVILPVVACNYTSYLMKCGDFPHELGLLLGYPVKDVEGFIRNKGEKYLYSGYWKVYDNVTEAISIFEQYTLAKEAVIKKVAVGMGILEIFELYNRKTALAAV